MTATDALASSLTTDRQRPAGPLGRASIGVVPIVWNNADLPDLMPFVPVETVLDEVARLGYAGLQTGVGFPAGQRLRDELERRGLHLAEVYAALPCGRDGPAPDALAIGRARLAELVAAGGDVLVVAAALSSERDGHAGRAAEPATPRLNDAGWRALAELVETLAREARAADRRVAFHQHAGTFVELPGELDRLLDEVDGVAGSTPSATGICLDVGHYMVGGGDPVAALRRYGERVTHVHLKDVAPGPLASLRAGTTGGFLEALRARIYTELGSGVLDLAGVLARLAERDYAGWIMVEQDTTWAPPSESAAIGRRILAYAIRGLAAGGPR